MGYPAGPEAVSRPNRESQRFEISKNYNEVVTGSGMGHNSLRHAQRYVHGYAGEKESQAIWSLMCVMEGRIGKMTIVAVSSES
jgi:hypothetical protein